jgi:nucleotide-binding universal stress UspA family protein
MTLFPTRILLATDGSEDAGLAATSSVALAKATGSELHVTTVGEGYPPHDAYRPLAERSRQLARKILYEQVEKIRNLGGTVARSHLKVGSAQEEVVTLAEELGAGLIIAGSRGKGRIKRLVMGGVSDSVVRHAHCPVLVVRGKAAVFPAKILLATDGSEDAELAASTAAELAGVTGSELHAVTVAVEYPYVYAYYDLRHKVEVERFRQQAREVLDRQADPIRKAGGTLANKHLRVGVPDEEIVLLAEELGTSLIVLGSRGLGSLRRALVGSVSDSVVRHAHCPVLVTRRKDETAGKRT